MRLDVMHSFLIALVAVVITFFLIGYFSSAIGNVWRTRRKRRSYGKMVSLKPGCLRDGNRDAPKVTERKRH